MTLGELLDVYDYNRESDYQFVELCRPGMNWDDYDRVPTGSCLLIPFYSAKIKCIGADNKSAIRVEVDWDELDSRTHLFDWNKEAKQ